MFLFFIEFKLKLSFFEIKILFRNFWYTFLIKILFLQAGAKEVFMGPALELLAAKVASVSGDARRALEIGRRSLEVGARKRPLAPTDDNETVTSPKKSKAKGQVGLLQVKQVLDSVYGGSQQTMDSEEEELPLQQKILVCCLLLLKRQPAKKNTIGKVKKMFKIICVF